MLYDIVQDERDSISVNIDVVRLRGQRSICDAEQSDHPDYGNRRLKLFGARELGRAGSIYAYKLRELPDGILWNT